LVGVSVGVSIFLVPTFDASRTKFIAFHEIVCSILRVVAFFQVIISIGLKKSYHVMLPICWPCRSLAWVSTESVSWLRFVNVPN
jgi:hypothetical protein